MGNRSWYQAYISSWGDEEPSQFAEAFARTIPINPGKTRLLDVGCGSGIIGIHSLIEKKARSVTFTDKESFWMDVARSNVDIKIGEREIAASQTRLLSPSGFAELPYAEVAQHDLLAFNPPQLPYAYVDEETRQQIDSNAIEQSFRRGGETGLEVVAEFLNWYSCLPSPKPDAVILLSSFLGRKRISHVISQAGLRLCEKPLESNATLRRMFWKQAEAFLASPTETIDRSIHRCEGVWYKKLLTYRLTNR